MSWLLSLDCGKQHDYSVLGAIECSQRIYDPNLGKEGEKRLQRYLKRHPVKIMNMYVLRGLTQFDLGTDYDKVTNEVAHKYNNAELMGEVTVLVDAGGVGLAVMDMLRAKGVPPLGIMLKGSGEATMTNGIYHVSKEEVVLSLVVAFQSRRLVIIDTLLDRSDGKQLVKQLDGFQMKPPNARGHRALEAGKEEVHDDMVMMLAQAIWFGGKTQFQTMAEGPLEEPEREQEDDAYNPLTWGLPR